MTSLLTGTESILFFILQGGGSTWAKSMTEILFELVIYFPTFPNAMGHHLLHPLNGQPFASSRPYICASGDFTRFRVWPGYGLFPCFCKEAQNLSDVSVSITQRTQHIRWSLLSLVTRALPTSSEVWIVSPGLTSWNLDFGYIRRLIVSRGFNGTCCGPSSLKTTGYKPHILFWQVTYIIVPCTLHNPYQARASYWNDKHFWPFLGLDTTTKKIYHWCA